MGYDQYVTNLESHVAALNMQVMVEHGGTRVGLDDLPSGVNNTGHHIDVADVPAKRATLVNGDGTSDTAEAFCSVKCWHCL